MADQIAIDKFTEPVKTLAKFGFAVRSRVFDDYDKDLAKANYQYQLAQEKLGFDWNASNNIYQQDEYNGTGFDPLTYDNYEPQVGFLSAPRGRNFDGNNGF
jgi:hypothetical protein